MYLKINQNIELVKLGKMILPNSTEESLCHDCENVYEWMYVDLPAYDFSLNVSRNHGMADIDDEIFDQHTEDELKEIIKPGPIYIFGWNKQKELYVDDIPEELIETISKKTDTTITVYPGRVNVDSPDPEPLRTYNTKT